MAAPKEKITPADTQSQLIQKRRLPRRGLRLFAFAVFILLLGIFFLLPRRQISQKEFILSDRAVSKDGPIAQFIHKQQPSRWRLPRWLRPRITEIGSSSRMWVQRHGEWQELPPEVTQTSIKLLPFAIEGTGKSRKAAAGYTVEVNVPVCKEWRIEVEWYEIKRFGPKDFGYLTQSNRWNSASQPGWSAIRQSFNETK
ncbi:MAG TPA: hypothetical protein VF773_18575 [Verrucomicrobiae bacterium]